MSTPTLFANELLRALFIVYQQLSKSEKDMF